MLTSCDGIFPWREQGLMGFVWCSRQMMKRARASRNGVSLPHCILIVEPDDMIRELLERWLGEAGYRVAFPTKTPEARMVMPSLVIADLSDPGTAGDTISSLQAAYCAPILALSARFRRGLGGSSETAHRLQVGKLLPKPFTREELQHAVHETVQQT